MKDSREYQSDLVNKLLQEIFSIIAEEANQNGLQFAQDMAMQFLAQYIGTCVLNSLTGPAETAPPGTSEAGKFTLSWANYQEEKGIIEDSIAEGFRLGWQAYNPQTDPEMICQILTVQETPSDPKISH